MKFYSFFGENVGIEQPRRLLKRRGLPFSLVRFGKNCHFVRFFT
jgi:hypothetical protein